MAGFGWFGGRTLVWISQTWRLEGLRAGGPRHHDDSGAGGSQDAQLRARLGAVSDNGPMNTSLQEARLYGLTEYMEAAAQTAEPAAYDLAYLLPGLVGEVGELFGKFAKEHWHGFDMSEDIALEYGDIAWLTAILIKSAGTLERDQEMLARTRPSATDQEALEGLLSRVASVYRAGHGMVGFKALGLWQYLAANCPVMTGYTWAQVLQMNLDKLAARKADGTLRGNGDHR